MDLHYSHDDQATPILCDNQSCIKIDNNLVFHARMKHVKNHHHFIWNCIANGDISLIYCPFEDNVGGIFTKTPMFNRHQVDLGIRDISKMSRGVVK